MADFSKNLFTYFRTADPALENRDFIVSSASGRFTYGDLDRRSAQIAHSLVASGVRPGDRVAVQTQKCVEFIFLYCACLRVGAIFLPLNPAYTAHEISYFLRDSQAHTFVTAPERLNELEPIARESGVKFVWTLAAKAGSLLRDADQRDSRFTTVDRSENDLAAILYTSGTTGRSKGAMLSHQNLISNALTLIHEWGFADSDVLIHSLPLFHTHGLFVACHCVLFSGSSMIFNEKFDPSSAIAQFEKGTVLMGVPTFYTRLLEEVSLRSDRLGQMRLFISGSAPLLSETHVAFEQRTKMKILERYGMTETTMLTSNPLEGMRKAGSVGKPLPQVELRIVDAEGEPCAGDEIGAIQVRGPNVFSGYWHMPEKTKESFTADGFFVTGDVGLRDSDGFIHIVGREKDLIISGGLNVYPKEIETILDESELVRESAVIGVPHPDFGEAVVAIVVLEKSRLSQEEFERTLMLNCKAKLASYKSPKQIFFVDELPRNTMGKVQKAELRSRYRDIFVTNK